MKEANNFGIDSERIIFAKRMSMEDHLARHKSADLFLDTYPYGAHTTCSDALWAGLPVVTLAGHSFASRVAGSLLNAIDLPELITYSKEDYEKLILNLSTDVSKLNEIKKKLNNNRLSKPLFDTKLYTKNLEDAYIEIYEKNFKKFTDNNL